MKRRMWFSVLVGLVCTTSSALPLAVPAAATQAVPSGPAAATTTAMSATEFESRLFRRTNARRDRHGCRPLRAHSALVLAAHRHSALMADRRELSHRLAGEADLATRIERAGYTNWRMLAENLAWGQSRPGAVFRAWVRSAGHRANLDNCRLRHVGIGVEIRRGNPWVTADFGRRHG